MNRQGGNGIEWTDYTWNPVTGCKTGCSYCYARRAAKRWGDDFTPKFHAERLDEPTRRKTPSKVAVCLMGDLFGPWVPKEWQVAVRDAIGEAPQHTFQILTQYPDRIWDGSPGHCWPQNVWFGATATNALEAAERADMLCKVVPGHIRYLSCEPWLEQSAQSPTVAILAGVHWVIIGAMTGTGKRPVHPRSVSCLIGGCDIAGVAIFCKRSVHHICKRQEWPKEGDDD